MRILLVTDEVGYADDVISASHAIGVGVTVAPSGCSLAREVREAGADVVALDAGNRFGSSARMAEAFAARHPHLVVAVLATGVDDHEAGNFLLAHRWNCAERLLDRLALAYLDLQESIDRRPAPARTALAP
jgi:DNA-binding NarL/FixJ family response regulator